ncbi:flagellar brake protein [Evansella cellulosilytica]|uniref:Type IV pilus assembly PilZ n=1 Tax=Evansella cellulosilytica (strain ATCC 21833 / DSM 2522 / FERM P-1141 / JCM 9156 / N-4) TaxID=649639 RepID=E6TZD6_EVAC2|nr:flagellar brake domain-containing protein [Evansella cellulosilytica]ADU30110.1 type IV pilus assembly PilZ [Evansella cellulosilytica DSM 2522]
MIKVGTTIFLELNPVEENKRYRSKILDYEDNKIFIDFPVDENTKKPHFFLEGTEFRAWFLGKDEAIYLFHTEVVGKIERKMPMLLLKDPGIENYRRIQRRQYVRIESAVDVAVHPVQQHFEPFTTVTLDISGGGMAILLPEAHTLQPNIEITVWLPLHFKVGDMAYIKCSAKIVRIIKESGREKASLQFSQISEIERQKIVRFCFEKQLAIRKKETSL